MEDRLSRVELLAPAGNMECLKTALYFGADAVYMSGKRFGLRAFADNFTQEELKEAAQYAHERGKKVYVTVNAVARSSELEDLQEYIFEIKNAGVDAAIISDPALIGMCKKADLEIHLSTQVSTQNYLSARFWGEQGIARVVAAREATLSDITQMCQNNPQGPEIEVFVHGAMCVAYSGRCLLSSVLTKRSGNRGECAQPCRWEYVIREANMPDIPIQEDERGTYLLNSKDLMMLPHIPELVRSGVKSLKIEGRMKSAYYVACVVNAYRRALDAFYDHPESYETDSVLVRELELSATRQFCTGFYFDEHAKGAQDTEKGFRERGYIFCAVVKGVREDGLVCIEQRNRFFTGDTVAVLSPNKPFSQFIVGEFVTEKGESRLSAPHPQEILYIDSPVKLKAGDILRLCEV